MDSILTSVLFLDFVVAIALAIVLAKGPSKRRNVYAPFAASLVVAALAGFAAGYPVLYLAGAAAFALIASLLAICYATSARSFLALLAFTALQLVYMVLAGVPILSMFTLGFAVGTFFGVLYIEKAMKRENSFRRNKKLEINRDIFEIALGAVALFILAIFRGAFPYIMVALILIAYAYNSVARKMDKGFLGSVSHALNGLERKDAVYGTGALYLAVGFMLMLSFIHSYSFLAFGIIVLVIADSAATIVGKCCRIASLPYNKAKSLGGFIGFFFVSAAGGYIVFGALLPVLACSLALAFLESLDLRVDDNVLLSIGVIALYALQIL